MQTIMFNHKRACDRCHQKKTRCVRTPDGCKSCEAIGARCIFSTRKDKGRIRQFIVPDTTSEPCVKRCDPTAVEETFMIGSLSSPQDNFAPDSSSKAWNTEGILQDAIPRLGYIRLPEMVATDVPTVRGQGPYEALQFKTATLDHVEGDMVEGDADDHTGNFAASLHASTPALVPHATSTLTIPVYLSHFQAAISVKIYLPVLRCLPSSISLFSITRYLTALAWSPSDSPLIEMECRELLGALASIAKDLMHMVRDKAMKDFLVLLSRLGQQVSLSVGIWVEFCGLSTDKAVLRCKGNVFMVDIDQVTKILVTG